MFILSEGKTVDQIKGVYLHIQRNKANFKAFIVTYSPLYVGKHSTTGIIRRWALGSRQQQMWEMWARSNLLKYKHVANGLMRFSLTVFTLHHHYCQGTPDAPSIQHEMHCWRKIITPPLDTFWHNPMYNYQNKYTTVCSSKEII